MSPEDIFASQMWPWPEPALKRDSMGRVLFVNAAFLQMYGGTVDDWRGNVVTGWPTPQAAGVPYRFETRLPSDAGEQVYDWMEFTLTDGTAFAMARNVTYLFQAPDPQPGHEALPPMQDAQVCETPAVNSAQDFAAPNMPNQPVIAQAEPEYVEPAPVIQEPVIQEPVLQHEPVQAADPILEAAESVELPADVDVPEFENALADITQQPDMAPEAVVVEPLLSDTVQPEPQQSEPQQSEPAAQDDREFDRRPLPIENEEAVLGNNWRDAVIAKAVGAEPAVAAAAVGAAAIASDAGAEEATAPAASEEKTGQIRILLAEDNAINALLTQTLLEAEGHHVDTVEDGTLAVEAMKTSSFDLIFMDMRMPNMDGLEATRKIRAMSNVSKGLPIIALTANAFDDDRNACFDSGMNDFMTKPVSAEELSEMVRTWTKNLAERNAA